MTDLMDFYFEHFSIYGLGIHVLVAIFFAVHAIRRGLPMYWLWVLFVFPVLGSVVYFFAVYLPNSRLEMTLRQGSSDVMRLLNPGKSLREARKAYELTPSVGNQMRIGLALLARRKVEQANAEFDECLKHAPANDLDVRLAAAHAKMEANQPEQVLTLLREVRAQNSHYYAQDVTLLSAKALAATGQQELARQQFEYGYKTFGDIETRVEYAIWLKSQHQDELAQRVRDEVLLSARHFTKHAKWINKPLMQRLHKAFKNS